MASAKINKESKNLYLARALYDAVEDSNIQQVNSLLSRNKANPNILIPEEGMTPFHLAAGHENLAFGKIATSLFLHNNGNPNVRCDGNRTVLHISVAWNRSSVVEILLKSPYIIPDPFLKDDDGLNVFNYAVKFSAWESLSTLHSFVRYSNYTSNTNNQVGKTLQSKCNQKEKLVKIEEEKMDKSVDTKSEFNKSDKLHISSGYFNSGESLNSTPKSTKHNSESQINNVSNESSSTVNSFNNVLNKNISTDHFNVSSHIYCNESRLSSIIPPHDSFEDFSFSSEDSLSNTELSEMNKIEITENQSSQEKKKMYLSNSFFMTDISDLSNASCLGSDDYFTCPDSNSGYHNVNHKTDIELEDISNIPIKNFGKSLSISITNIPMDILNLKISEDLSSDDNSSSETIDDYDTDYLRQSLRQYGYSPGPLVRSTKQLYVRKLKQIMKDNKTELKNDHKIINNNNNIDIVYSSQLTQVLMDSELATWKQTLKSWSSLEKDIIYSKCGSSFTYLLLDPRITKDLPARVDEITPIETWKTFIESIFYIGKGTQSRPNDHMNEAMHTWIGINKCRSEKTDYIINLWKEKKGVVCVQAFHNLVLKEAHIREAAMIDAIGLDQLTNLKRGTYYDSTVQWKSSDRIKLGCYLLYRAMHVFLADGERQLGPFNLT